MNIIETTVFRLKIDNTNIFFHNVKFNNELFTFTLYHNGIIEITVNDNDNTLILKISDEFRLYLIKQFYKYIAIPDRGDQSLIEIKLHKLTTDIQNQVALLKKNLQF